MADILNVEHHQVLEEYQQTLAELLPNVSVGRSVRAPTYENFTNWCELSDLKDLKQKFGKVAKLISLKISINSINVFLN